MLKDGTSFVVKKPKSLLHKDLSADWKGMFKAGGKMAAHALTKREDMLADGAEFLTALGLETTVEDRLWVLIQSSLAPALGELLAPEFAQRDPAVLDGLVAALLSVEEFKVEQDFLDFPEKLALLADISKTLKTWMAETEFSSQVIENVVERLPRYFVYALHHEWRKNESAYSQITKATATPLSAAVQRQAERAKNEQAWGEYRAFLRKQVDTKLFDESFGLRQIFVPLRAYYELKPTTSRESRLQEEKTERHVVELADCLNDFLKTAPAENRLRLIAGGPGSGKSSFSKMWAAQLAERDDLRVLYVPLNCLDVEQELPEAIDEFLQDDVERDTGFVLLNPLKARHPSKSVVLILDGLDELAMQGKTAQDTARRWFNSVRDFVRVENQRANAAPIFALVTGRDIAIQGVEMQRHECILHVLPYKISDLAEHQYRGDDELLEDDMRDLWWEKYSERSAQFDGQMPEEISGKDFEEITSWPLLNYLLAQTVREARKTGQKIEPDINEIYSHLLTAVFNRVWAAEGNLHLRESGFDEATFREVLQEVALTIWHSDGSAATEEAIEKQCAKAHLTESLNEFRKGAESGFARLLTAFYFRQKGQRAGERSFEFTHKSFGEYLTACRIVDELKSLCDEWEAGKGKGRRALNEESALLAWIEVCGPQKLDYYLARFVKREIQRNKANAGRWQKFLIALLNYSLRAGLPMESMKPRPDFSEEKRQARNAELCLISTLSACAYETKQVSEIEWPKDGFSVRAWIAGFLSSEVGDSVTSPWNFERAVESRFEGCFFNHFNVANANLRWIDLVNVNFENADLASAKMWNANLLYANLSQANLTHTNLISANLSGANLSGANLSGANLSGANLSRAKLNGAKLNGADLRGVRGLKKDMWELAKTQGAQVDGESPKE